jgi:VIT1/CCC1 family predicted Fe2+/Mn2+ transporter
MTDGDSPALGAPRVEEWREQQQSVWLYRTLAETEPDARLRSLFESLGEAAERQAALALGPPSTPRPAFRPSLRARLVAALARRIGVQRARPMLVALRLRGMSAVTPSAAPPIHPMPTSVTEVGARHRRGGGGNLRAAVFGVSDGLVSNTSLILAVAGAGAVSGQVALAGVAGLLAGAFSMAAGEYISMRSQRELFERQMSEERAELERFPEEEAEELALIYAARGVPLAQARAMTATLVLDTDKALDTLAREELGLNPDELGSPWGAALSSFLAFATGALLPLLPFLFGTGQRTLGLPVALSAAGLFAVGAALSLFSGKNAVLSGLRLLLVGAVSGATTFLIGRLLGVNLR